MRSGALAEAPAAFPSKLRLALKRFGGCQKRPPPTTTTLPCDTSSQFTPRSPGQGGPELQKGRSRAILPHNLLREALARDGPNFRKDAPVRYVLTIYSKKPWPGRARTPEKDAPV